MIALEILTEGKHMDCTIAFSHFTYDNPDEDFHLCVVETRRGVCSFGVPDNLAELVLTDASDAAIATRLWEWVQDNRPDVYEWAQGKQLRHTTPPPAPPPLRVVH